MLVCAQADGGSRNPAQQARLTVTLSLVICAFLAAAQIAGRFVLLLVLVC